jgi:hypothetical protein
MTAHGGSSRFHPKDDPSPTGLKTKLKRYGWLGLVAVCAAAVIVDTVRVVTERRKVPYRP